MVLIVSVLALAVGSIGLFMTAVILRSRSVATLNLVICLFAVIICWFSGRLTWPLTAFVRQPPVNEGMRMDWIAGMISLAFFSVSILGIAYTLLINTLLNLPQRLRRRKRRRRRPQPNAPVGFGREGRNGGSGDVPERKW